MVGAARRYPVRRAVEDLAEVAEHSWGAPAIPLYPGRMSRWSLPSTLPPLSEAPVIYESILSVVGEHIREVHEFLDEAHNAIIELQLELQAVRAERDRYIKRMRILEERLDKIEGVARGR